MEWLHQALAAYHDWSHALHGVVSLGEVWEAARVWWETCLDPEDGVEREQGPGNNGGLVKLGQHTRPLSFPDTKEPLVKRNTAGKRHPHSMPFVGARAREAAGFSYEGFTRMFSAHPKTAYPTTSPLWGAGNGGTRHGRVLFQRGTVAPAPAAATAPGQRAGSLPQAGPSMVDPATGVTSRSQIILRQALATGMHAAWNPETTC